ncbi:MAG: hypothetical protein WC494_01440 [Candidatus Pacearchaeota archaeon]
MVKKEEDTSSLNKEKPKKKMTAQEREQLLIENFVGLQHAMTNLSIKFSALSENINKLLQIFEEAANKFSPEPERKEIIKEPGNDLNKDLIRKIDSLIDQNKTIAQGLVIMEEKLRSSARENPYREETISHLRPRPLPNI